jgi:hypothetical protein
MLHALPCLSGMSLCGRRTPRLGIAGPMCAIKKALLMHEDHVH